MQRHKQCHVRTTQTAKVISCASRIRYGPYSTVSQDPLPPSPPFDRAILPVVNRYFYIPQTSIDLTNGATIPATLFYDDHENKIDEFTIFNPNGYVNLHINGVIQSGGFYQVNSTTLTIKQASGVIRAGTPIILESLGFTST